MSSAKGLVKLVRIARLLIGLSVCIACLASGCETISPGPNSSRPTLGQNSKLNPKTDLQDVVSPEAFEEFLRRSTVESETFRRSLLMAEGDGTIPASRLAQSIVRFQEQASDALEDRRSLDAFELEAKRLVSSIAGDAGPLQGEAVYGGFEGFWFGLWDKMRVDHHWGPYVAFDPPKKYEMPGASVVYLRGMQIAWVGDGYGINHVCTTDLDSARNFLLGYVIHIEDGDISKERKRRPHVGITTGPGQIIWITAGEVFLEESFKLPGGKDAYAITGFNYRIEDGVLRASRGFQAIYSRDDAERIPWHSFPIELEVR